MRRLSAALSAEKALAENLDLGRRSDRAAPSDSRWWCSSPSRWGRGSRTWCPSGRAARGSPPPRRAVLLDQVGDADGVHGFSLFLPLPPAAAPAGSRNRFSAPRRETAKNPAPASTGRQSHPPVLAARLRRAPAYAAPRQQDREHHAADQHDVAAQRKVVAEVAGVIPLARIEQGNPQCPGRERRTGRSARCPPASQTMRGSKGTGASTTHAMAATGIIAPPSSRRRRRPPAGWRPGRSAAGSSAGKPPPT